MPKISAIPSWLETRGHGSRRRIADKHGELVNNLTALDQVMSYGLGELPTSARGQEASGAYLLLDNDDVVIADRRWELGIRVEAPVAVEPTVVVYVDAQPVPVIRREDRWLAQVPGLSQGLHQLRVVAAGLPGLGELVLNTQIGAVAGN